MPLPHARSQLRLVVLLSLLVFWNGPSCPRQPAKPSEDGKTYVVSFEAAHGFLKSTKSGVVIGPSDRDAEFILFDLNRGGLNSGDEVLLLTAQDSYLRGAAVGQPLRQVLSGTDQIGFCNTIVVIQAQKAAREIVDGSTVSLRVFQDVTITDADGNPKTVGDGCNRVAKRGAATLISDAAGVPAIVNAPVGSDELFTIHVKRTAPYTVTRDLSAPFANPEHFNAGNLMDLDWHVGVQRDYLGGARTYDDHTGIDFGWDWPGFRAMNEGGLAVLAVAPGTVVYVREDREDHCHDERQTPVKNKSICPPSDHTYDSAKIENEVIIRHDDGTVSVYAHIMKNSVPVAEGDHVECGDLIARVGSSGGSSGPHLHFELRRPHDPDFWAKHTDNHMTFPYFWDHSMIIDPYELQAWKKFRQVLPRTSASRQYIPLVTCVTDSNNAYAREGANIFQRSELARGDLYDWCDKNHSKCGQDYYCGPKGFCEPQVRAGDPCSNGYACPPLYGCINGFCRLGPKCENKCPTLKGCYVDGNQLCRKKVPKVEDCTPIAGNCILPCFRDGSGACKLNSLTKTDTIDCAEECLR